MALMFLSMAMFIALTAATIHALRDEARGATSKIAARGKWIN